ncbi:MULTISPECIES: hypothetical protein [Flavobacterium]|uniref:Rieske (2Fe-2S) protein n=1 Tax=Flavobacterium TaxID=237 RepID=UPI0008686919|nr:MULTISPECIES: hypothetical protein [Flavobacterium]MBN9285244.1 hypothetical protein [Flavobacterium sp.]ODS86754.1 MAG: hypothetical protein ABS44_12745 [Chryseobacterium sp. SCN 40-13]OJV72038.1 MAG: hypothetical protein BGO42_01355 [Flavobacterium sp. 40-81]
MKKYIFLLFLIPLIGGCSKDSVVNNNNPYLPNYQVLITIDTNLPSYSPLKFTNGSAYIAGPTAGIRGIILFNTGTGITAFDRACPNQSLSECSTMDVDGIFAVCSCDNKKYSLFTGIGDGQYPMKQYRTEQMGTLIRVFN